ncbi:MAG: hypothetical protein FD170_3033 [Bacteroidetes bacterium]|nr:MAG: hypothetical protein FD170_3033 [Bacteroidota bacterium]
MNSYGKFITTIFLTTLGVFGYSQINGVLWIPEGSTTNVIENVIQVTPPAGFVYVGLTSNGRVSSATGQVSVSCDCTSASGGCKPYIASGPGGASTSGCNFENGCTNCTGSTTANNRSLSFEKGGFINTKVGVNLLKQYAELPSFFGEMLDFQSVNSSLSSFFSNVYKGVAPPEAIKISNSEYQAPDGYVFVAVNIMGRGALIILSEETAKSMNISNSSKKYSCSCTQGSCSVTSNGAFGYKIYSCEGNCSGTCSLNSPSSSTRQYQY